MHVHPYLHMQLDELRWPPTSEPMLCLVLVPQQFLLMIDVTLVRRILK